MRERRGKRGAPNMVAGRMGLLLTAKGKSGQAGWGHKRWLWFRTCWVWDAHSSSRLTSQDINLKLKTTGQARIYTFNSHLQRRAIWNPGRSESTEGGCGVRRKETNNRTRGSANIWGRARGLKVREANSKRKTRPALSQKLRKEAASRMTGWRWRKNHSTVTARSLSKMGLKARLQR